MNAFNPEACLSTDPCDGCAIAALPTPEFRSAGATLASEIVRHQGANGLLNAAIWELPDVTALAMQARQETDDMHWTFAVDDPAQALVAAAAIFSAINYSTRGCRE